MEKLKYPIGKFEKPVRITNDHIQNWIRVIKQFPENLRHEIDGLDPLKFENTYRPGGWTITQIVNHCADSHMNALIRFKLTITENTPVIKPYQEHLWASLADSKAFPVCSSMKILDGLHDRWVQLLLHLTTTDLKKQFIHPETGSFIDLETNIGIYAWHCQHHLAHIKCAKQVNFKEIR